MSLHHWLLLLLTPRWLTLRVRGSGSPSPRAITGLCWLPFPICCRHALQVTGATHRSQETATTKPNFLIPASIGCDHLGSNGKLHHMVTLPSAQMSGEGPHLAASPLPHEVLLVPVLLSLGSEGLHIILLMQTMYERSHQQPVLYSGKFLFR